MTHEQAAGSPNVKLAAAIGLARYGFTVFPLIPNEKRPLIENWPNLATNEIQQIREWWAACPDANIGIATENLLVIDVDPRNGGDKTFRDLFETQRLIGQEFPPTHAAGTQGGGTHMFYWLPPHTSARGGANKLGPGVDIKSHGGYVVAPGSTVDGRAYYWKDGYGLDKPKLFAEAPQWLIAKCNAPKPKSADAGKVVVEEDDTALALAKDWIERNAPEAIQGGRDNTAYTVAARLYDFGVTRDTARELLEEWNEGRCHPPLEAHEIERLAWSAQHNRENAVGSKHPNAPGFEPVEIEPPKNDIGIPISGFFTPAARFDAADLPLRPWIIPGFACRARVTMLAGPGGVAKSTYTLMVAIAVVAQRNDICGFPVPKREPVAVWNQEDDLEEMQRRLAAIMQTFNVSWADLEDADGNPMLYLNSGVDNPLMIALRSQEGIIRPSNKVAEATADIKAKGIGLLILDPLVELHQAVENDNVQMRAVVSLVRDIAVKGDCAVLLATHTKKPPVASSDGFAGEMDAARGASSQFGVIRIGATLFSASPKDAKTWSMTGTHLDYVRLDIAKNNLAARTGEPMWFKRASEAVGGSVDAPGESVGVLRPIKLEERRVHVTDNLLELVAETLAGPDFGAGAWFKAKDVMDAAGIATENRNGTRLLREMFDGNEQVLTQIGKLKMLQAGGTSPIKVMLEPKLRHDARLTQDSNSVEESET